MRLMALLMTASDHDSRVVFVSFRYWFSFLKVLNTEFNVVIFGGF